MNKQVLHPPLAHQRSDEKGQRGGQISNLSHIFKGGNVAESVYKIIELVGTSTESWEKAAMAAVARASKTLRDLRIAEVVELDMQLEEGKVIAYRAKVKLSFKYEEKE